jgi:lipid II isoglutaminyl synthase (glutamine-hydrolysing)
MTCSGSRAAELALRMKYAGVDEGRLTVKGSLREGLDAALANGSGPLYALPTYTALLELRDLLAERGQVEGHWR